MCTLFSNPNGFIDLFRGVDQLLFSGQNPHLLQKQQQHDA